MFAVLAPKPPPSPPKSPPPPAVGACAVVAGAKEVVEVPGPNPPKDRLGANVVGAGAVPNRGAEVVAVELVFKLPNSAGLLFAP